MAHLLVIELPGGNDYDLLKAASDRGDRFTFLTQDLTHYKALPEVWEWIGRASHHVESNDFTYPELERLVGDIHREDRIEALLCLIDIRLIEASKLAKFLGVKYLNTTSAELLRDKFNVRERLRSHGIDQPEFHLATTNDEIQLAVDALGLPVLIKPSDGYGSQNILTLQSPDDLDPELNQLQNLLPIKSNYGLGVVSNDRLLVERYMSGVLIGCDTFTHNGKHQLLGVNQKLMFPSPSFAIKGGCFLPFNSAWKELEKYIFSLLDAVSFDYGATHIEIMVTNEGPRLVEINPRLVGAKIPRLISFSLNRSIHSDLIDLHLGHGLVDLSQIQDPNASVTRWITTSQAGTLESVELPVWSDDGIRCVEILKKSGEHVSYPFENSQRIGYVMTTAKTQAEAEEIADRFIADTKVIVQS